MKYFLLLIIIFVAACSTPSPRKSTPETSELQGFGFIPVNGINMYYETYGLDKGIPLLLIHGGGSTIESNFSRLIPLLEKDFRIIAIEEQAHGRTSDRAEGVSFEQTAKDVIALLDQLNVPKVNILGFSNGGTTGMVLAFRHPDRVNKLIAASALTNHSGTPKDFWKFMQKANLSNMPKPLAEAFLKVNPDPQKLQNMHDKDAKRMQTFRDIPDRELKKIQAPTLIMLGDQDLITVPHAIYHQKMIKGSRLAVLPGNHGDYLGEVFATQDPKKDPAIAAGIIKEFLSP